MFRNKFKNFIHFIKKELTNYNHKNICNESSSKISLEEIKLINNVVNLKNLKVTDVMIPRTDIKAIPHNISITEFKKLLSSSTQHTRMPIYQDTLDNILGFVNIKDLIPILLKEKKINLNNITRELPLVPPSMKALDLLAQMRFSRTHIALVIDEYGGTDGLVTIEDLVEEIVGEIEDEYDVPEGKLFSLLGNDKIVANARMTVEDLEKILNIKLIKDDEHNYFDTIGGLILSITGSLPKKGEKINHKSGVVFEILDTDPRRIRKVLIIYKRND